MSEYFHGIRIILDNTEPRPLDYPPMAIVGLIGTAPQADAGQYPLDEPQHIFSHEATKIAALGAEGTLKDSLDAITDQGIHAELVIVRVAEGASVEETLSQVVGDAALQTGVHAFYKAAGTLGVLPTILIAPGFTSIRPSDTANPVVAELTGLADKLMAVVIADGPDTNKEDALVYRGDFNSDRLIIVDPHCKVYRDGQVIVQPSAPRIAGLAVKRDRETGGPFHSWSNQAVQGISGLSRPLSYLINDPASEVNWLNSKQVAAIYRETGELSGAVGGYTFWGNESATNDPLWRFYNVRRGRDFIHRTLLRSFKPFLGGTNIGLRGAEAIAEQMNAFMRSLKAKGHILDGKVWFDPGLNDPLELRAGKFRFEFAVEEPAPLQTLTFGSHRLLAAYELLVGDILSSLSAQT